MNVLIIPNPSGAKYVIFRVGENKTSPITCIGDAIGYLNVFFQLGIINESELQKILLDLLDFFSLPITSEPIWLERIMYN